MRHSRSSDIFALLIAIKVRKVPEMRPLGEPC